MTNVHYNDRRKLLHDLVSGVKYCKRDITFYVIVLAVIESDIIERMTYLAITSRLGCVGGTTDLSTTHRINSHLNN